MVILMFIPPYNKRASMEFLLSMLGLLIAFVIVLFLFKSIFNKASTTYDGEDICRNSVLLHSASKIEGISLYDSLHCPTQYVTLDTFDESSVKQKLSQQMLSCSYKFGKGAWELFALQPGLDNTFCAVCSVFETPSGYISDFGTYLTTERVPLRYGRESYYSYLYGSKPTQSQQEAIALLDDDLSFSTPYGVYFVYTKTGYISKILGGSTAGVAGLVVGTIAGIVFTGGLAAPALIGVVSGLSLGAGGYVLGSEDTASWTSAVVAAPYTSETLQQLGCKELPVH